MILENGKPRAGYFWRAEQSVVVGAIQLTWTAPCWSRLVQVTANWEPAVPTTSEYLTCWKNHIGTDFDVVIFNIDPSAAGLNLKDWWCGDYVYLEPGEIWVMDYPNSDNQAVGFEAYFQRLDRQL